MKKSLLVFLSFCLAITVVLSATPSSSSAQTIVNYPEDNNNKTVFSDSFVNTVEDYIVISDKEFKITDSLALRKKITSEEFVALKEQIELMNSQIREFGKNNLEVKNQTLVSYLDFEEVNGDIVTTYAAKAKEGITKVEFKIWGYKIWLSKTNVEKILKIGSTSAGSGIGALGGVPTAVVGAIIGGVLGEFASPSAARALYFEVVYPIIVMKVKYQ